MVVDAQVCGDILAGMTGEDEVQDLPLTRRQVENPYRSRLPCRLDPRSAAMISNASTFYHILR